jgi:hypothetical protein
MFFWKKVLDEEATIAVSKIHISGVGSNDGL